MIEERSVWDYLDGGYLAVPFSFLAVFDAQTAHWLAFMVSKQKYFREQGMVDQEGFFFYGQRFIEQELYISPDKQTRIIKELVGQGVIQTYQKGIPPKRYYKIDLKQLMSLISLKNRQQRDLNAAGSGINMPPAAALILTSNTTNSTVLDKSVSTNVDTLGASGEAPVDIFSKYSPAARELLLFWNDLDKPLRQVQERDTAVFRKAMEGIDMTLNRGYSAEEVASAMVNYQELLTMKASKLFKCAAHQVGLDNFFKFSDFIKQAMPDNSPAKGIKSWFDECMRGGTYLANKYGRYIHDENPAVTKAFRQGWVAGPSYIGELEVTDENNFRKATTALLDWMDERWSSYQLPVYQYDHPEEFVKARVFPAIKEYLGDRDPKIINSYFLCKRDLYYRWLHLHLERKGLYNG